MTVPLLKRLRQSKGWSVRELGRQTGVSKNLISRLETRQQIDTQYHVWRRLARKLEISPEALAEGMIPDELQPYPSR